MIKLCTASVLLPTVWLGNTLTYTAAYFTTLFKVLDNQQLL